MPSIGFNVSPDYSIAEQVELARRCEELGYDDVWVSEISDPDAFVVAAAMALATSRVRLGTSIVALGPRSVPVLASAAASVAELSGGRFTLGVGVSTPVIVTGWHGRPSDRPLERVRESIPLLRTLLAGERSDAHGAQVKSSGFRLRRPPVAAIPVMLAALNERMLETAGALADAVVLNYVPLRRIAAVRETVRRGAKRAGRPEPEVVLSMACEVCDDEAAARRRWAREFAFYLTAPPYKKALTWHGYGDEVTVAERAWSTGGMRALREAVAERFVDELTVIGTAEHCRERISELQAAGVSLGLAVPAGSDPLPTLEELAALTWRRDEASAHVK